MIRVIIITLFAFLGVLMADDILKSSEENVEFFFEVIKNRRSVREFKPDQVPKQDIIKLLDAARMAPTSGNQQPWKFVVVQDKDQINKLREISMRLAEESYRKNNLTEIEITERLSKKQEYYDIIFSAPTFIVVLTDDESTWPSYNIHDGPLAAENLILAARALGYGTVYMTDSISVAASHEAFNIPETFTRVCMIPLGIPVEWPEVHEKKALEEFIIWETF